MNIIFPDHYVYSLSDIQKIKRKAKMNNLKILTTEKDFVELKEYRKDIQFLKINLEILEISNLENLSKVLYEKHNLLFPIYFYFNFFVIFKLIGYKNASNLGCFLEKTWPKI